MEVELLGAQETRNSEKRNKVELRDGSQGQIRDTLKKSNHKDLVN